MSSKSQAAASTAPAIDSDQAHDVALEAAQAAHDVVREREADPVSAAKAVVEAYLAARQRLAATS